MTITNSQRLSICKFLAEKMGVQSNKENSEGFPLCNGVYMGGETYDVFNPFTNPAQRMEVIDAAWADGLQVTNWTHEPLISCEVGGVVGYTIRHNNTPESRAEAVLVAISRAWGHES